MPVYEFVAFDERGKRIKGLIDADTLAQARSRLRTRGNFPVTISESHTTQSDSHRSALSVWRLQRVSNREITAMTRQLATLLGAGIPLVESLDVLLQQAPGAVLKTIIAAIREEINQGRTLTAALATHGHHFPPLYINMVRAGEAAGNLEVVLERLAEVRERQDQMQGKLRAALAYPLLMAVFGIAVVAFLLVYVVPGISEVFRQSVTLLPLPTRLLLAGSGVVRQYWWALALGLLLVLWAVDRLRRSENGRRAWDGFRLRFPVLGDVGMNLLLARFAVTLSGLLRSGVGLLPSLAIVRALVDNVLVGEALDTAMARITAGESLAESLADSPWFPPALRRMIGVGERSGSLEKMLEKSAAVYEGEAEASLTALTALLEPLMIVVMGVAVGFVVLSILLPIFEMSQMIG